MAQSGESAPGSKANRYWRLAAVSLSAIAILLVAAAVALPFIARGVFKRKLAELLPLGVGSVTYDAWVSSDLRFQIWMWNLTNPAEVLDPRYNATPSLAQVGPFTFKETRNRENVQFHANNTVAFDDVRAFYFLPAESIGEMRDYNITNVNLPYLGVAMRTRFQSVFVRKILSGTLTGRSKKGGLFVTRTVEELLLGYDDPAMLGLSRMARLVSPSTAKLPSRFGVLLGKNGTAKGSAVVGTGAGNLSQLNRMHQWNGQSSLGVWRLDWANQVSGTDGSMFTPPVSQKQPLVVFTSDLCRSFNMTHRRSDTVEGIAVLSFSPAKSSLTNASANPDNAAFCTPRCLGSGVLNLTLCMPGGPPLVASAPHFYGAPVYASSVAGLRGVGGGGGRAGEFETRLDVEPSTGLLMRAARRMQINAAVESVEGFPETQRFGDLFLMPYLWLNESGAISPDRADAFKKRVLGPLRLASGVSWALLAAGIGLAIIAGAVWWHLWRLTAKWELAKQRQQQQQQQLLYSKQANNLNGTYTEKSAAAKETERGLFANDMKN